MKRLLLSTALLLAVAFPVLAADDEEAPAPPQNPKAAKLVSASLPVCSAAMTVKRVGMQHKLPPSFVGTVVRAESERSQCKGQWLSIVTGAGDHYFGMPWFLDEQAKLPTIEEKLKDFTWKNFQTPFEVKIDPARTRSGLYKVVLTQQYEGGKVPLPGEVDPDGQFLFIGHFSPLDADINAERLKAFAPYADKAPTEGGKAPKVTIIEFSDFECPSCKHAAGYLDPILKKYGNDVKYVRYDLPLMMMHPWAFPAALAGRTIYRQKPELFWEYKKQVYENQDKLTAFTIDEFAHNFAADHELDLKKYEAGLASPEIRNEILNGIGVAFSNNIMATPSYVVNGKIVDPGDDGKGLETYVAKLLNEKVAAK